MIVTPHRGLLVEAGQEAARRHLRGYDAVHLSSALALGDPDVLVAAWDERLRNGAASAGLGVVPLGT